MRERGSVCCRELEWKGKLWLVFWLLPYSYNCASSYSKLVYKSKHSCQVTSCQMLMLMLAQNTKETVLELSFMEGVSEQLPPAKGEK